jgi:glycosyltransferase involved in cell wall biosynthesis
MAALRPDLVHVPSAADAYALAALVKAIGSRLVVSIRWDDVDGLGFAPERDGAIWESADAFHLETEALDALGHRRGRPERPTAVIAPVPDPELAAGPRRDSSDHGSMRILSLGPLSWTHGYEHALSALRLLADHGVGCVYRIVGQGEFADALAFARHQLGLESLVEFVEPNGRRDFRDHLRWADVLLNAAVVPSSPKPLVDAWALGLPVVTTETAAGLGELAIAVPRRDPGAIAAALAALAASPSRRRAPAEPGRLQAPTGSTDPVERFCELYRRTLGETR